MNRNLTSKINIRSALIVITLVAVAFVGSKTGLLDYGLPSGEITTIDGITDDYEFKSNKLLHDHFERHGLEMGYESPYEYEEGANIVLHSDNLLHKIEKEDGDDVYYLEKTNELVIVSRSGYIRTYFKPDNGIEYFYRQ